MITPALQAPVNATGPADPATGGGMCFQTRDLHVYTPDEGPVDPKPNQGSATTRATRTATTAATSTVAVVQPDRSAGAATVAADQPEWPVPPFPQVTAHDEEKSMESTPTPAPAGWLRWKGLLATAVLVSIAGNVSHAVLTAPTVYGWGAAAAASISPLFLFWVTHNLVTAPGGASGWRENKIGTLVVGAVALGAFAASFITLRDLMLTFGFPPAIAVIIPLVVDVTIAGASWELVREAATRHGAPAASTQRATQRRDAKQVDAPTYPDELTWLAPAMRDAAPVPAATQTPVNRDAEPTHTATHQSTTRGALRDACTEELPVTSGDSRDAPAKHGDDAATTRRLTTVPTTRTTATHAPASSATQTVADRDAEYLLRAQQLVDAGRTKAPVDVVVRVLRGKANGETNRAVAASTGLTDSQVQRIVTAARELEAAEPAFA